MKWKKKSMNVLFDVTKMKSKGYVWGTLGRSQKELEQMIDTGKAFDTDLKKDEIELYKKELLAIQAASH